ncbi:hypothetical protein [Thauera sp. AutoDN2]|uniref:hypothetical protein n=1 Tax=Thauera sp. AutoDN2 TaxID=3416051 RepID=UPI003F4B1FA9
MYRRSTQYKYFLSELRHDGRTEGHITFLRQSHMSKVYLMNKNAQTSELERVKCKDENKELQRLLERNPLLLSGEQIDPDNRKRSTNPIFPGLATP